MLWRLWLGHGFLSTKLRARDFRICKRRTYAAANEGRTRLGTRRTKLNVRTIATEHWNRWTHQLSSLQRQLLSQQCKPTEAAEESRCFVLVMARYGNDIYCGGLAKICQRCQRITELYPARIAGVSNLLKSTYFEKKSEEISKLLMSPTVRRYLSLHTYLIELSTTVPKKFF